MEKREFRESRGDEDNGDSGSYGKVGGGGELNGKLAITQDTYK